MNDNYKYFISPGTTHGIIILNDFYSLKTNSVFLLDWINAMVKASPDFVDVECTGDCGKPENCPECL